MEGRPLRVAVDAMGGDYAPRAVVEGAVRASRDLKGEVVLVGDNSRVQEELKRYSFPKRKVKLVHASQVVAMDESPSKAVRSKADSSIRVAIDLMADGEVDAVVTAGNSGAAMAIAMWRLKRLHGVERPALASLHPSVRGYTVVLDVGANVDCRPLHLVQFAIMGEIYARLVLKRERPAVGLLSNGTEDTKGNEVTRKAHQMLKRSSLNYVGYIEGKDIYAGDVDVVVCDGFVGNVVLKASEGMGDFLKWILRREIRRSFLAQIGYLLMGKAWRRIVRKVDYTSYGGVPLLGVRGVCFICHGHSSPLAIERAVLAAADYVIHDVNTSLVRALEESQELKRWGALRFWEHFRDRPSH